MKLIRRTIVFMSTALLIALSAWAFTFYVNMIDEVHDSIDDGLDNSKLLIIHEAGQDSTVLNQRSFDEGNYAIHKISGHKALKHVDRYKDTLMYMQNEDDLEPVRLLTTVFEAKKGEFYQLKIISSMVEEDDLIEDLFYSLVWLYVILIMTIILINTLVLRSMWKPFFQFLDRLSKFKLEKNEHIQPVYSKIAEFQVLSKVVTEVLESNIRSYYNQKQLIENASHEIQTPLAIALNKLQLLAENPELSEQAVKEVFQTIETLERLTRLNRSLLLLSKIENKQFLKEEIVDFNHLLKEVVEDFRDQMEFKEVELSLVSETELLVRMNPELARILVTNLVKNAVRHTVKKGRIEVLIRDKMLQISNTGRETALDPDKVFHRFYKESDSTASTGLGLAIVQSIADSSACTVGYDYALGVHRFVVIFGNSISGSRSNQ